MYTPPANWDPTEVTPPEVLNAKPTCDEFESAFITLMQMADLATQRLDLDQVDLYHQRIHTLAQEHGPRCQRPPYGINHAPLPPTEVNPGRSK